MKKSLILCLFGLCAMSASAQQPVSYYLPENTRYHADIPSPELFYGFQIGAMHLTHDKLLRYFETLAQKSERVKLIFTGMTHEKQPLFIAVITSPQNQKNLDKLRKDHLEVLDPTAPSSAVRKDPLVVWLGYSVHGNEPSGANAAPLMAYYLAAGENDDIVQMLDQSIILINPCLNPDGLNRFASWVNSRKSANNNPDLNSVEFSEPWPGGRGNHYWFDLNRDWLWMQHPETKAIIEQFQYWKPHILTDHHEMGSNSTFFFQPGVQSRSNPLVPEANFALTQKIGIYHAQALDAIGSLYFTEEMFDDFYLGKGSAYPDINGSIGILFEQAASRGHLRSTPAGDMSFAFTIRNQVKVSLSTLKASQDLSKELKYNQIDFYHTALKESEKSNVKAYIFGETPDAYRASQMARLLLKHQIRLQALRKPVTFNGVVYEPGKAWVVPLRQLQYRLIRTLFEKNISFSDSTFYDVSTWTLPFAMGVHFEALDEKELSQVSLDAFQFEIPTLQGKISGDPSNVGYLIRPDAYQVHQAIYKLQQESIKILIAQKEFSLYLINQLLTFFPGTLFIPAQNQPIAGFEMHQLLEKMANDFALEVMAVPTSLTWQGPDLGSGSFAQLEMPRILCFGGEGTSSREVGQFWYFLDNQLGIPLTIADIEEVNRIDLSKYNVLLMPGGGFPEPTGAFGERVKEWVRNGGRIIASRSAAGALTRSGLVQLTPVKEDNDSKSPASMPYAERGKTQIGNSIPGTIFQSRLDTTHPLGYGYHRSDLMTFKASTAAYQLNSNPYENAAVYEDKPLVSGYANEKNLKMIAGSAAIQRQSAGSGCVIYFTDDPLFRGYWASTHKILLNAIFWGDI